MNGHLVSRLFTKTCNTQIYDEEQVPPLRVNRVEDLNFDETVFKSTQEPLVFRLVPVNFVSREGSTESTCGLFLVGPSKLTIYPTFPLRTVGPSRPTELTTAIVSQTPLDRGPLLSRRVNVSNQWSPCRQNLRVRINYACTV